MLNPSGVPRGHVHPPLGLAGRACALIQALLRLPRLRLRRLALQAHLRRLLLSLHAEVLGLQAGLKATLILHAHRLHLRGLVRELRLQSLPRN